MRQSQEIVYRRENIIKRYVLRNKVIGVSQNSLAQLFLAVCFFKQLFKRLKGNVLVNSKLIKLS